jgi:dihydropteroate synthase
MENKSKPTKSITTLHGELDFKTPKIMGILNSTPDSFFDGGVNFGVSKSLDAALSMIEQGASIIDIGGQSTRPNSERISASEEIDRIATVIEALRNYKKDIILSVDTYQSIVAKKAIELGADIINDISSGTMDSKMIQQVAQLNVPYIAMHMQGTPNDMQLNPTYQNVTEDIYQYLNQKIKDIKAAGIEEIIIDPGFGFGKTMNQNYELLKNMKHFKTLDTPLLVGISRKSFIYKPLNIVAAKSLPATSALHLYCLQQGANILRVHDVKEAQEVIQLFLTLENI